MNKTHEFKVLPSYRPSALLLYCRRATYIVKLTLSSPLLQSPFLFCFEQIGWHNKDGNTQITWETGHPSNVEESSDSEHDLDSADDTEPEQADSSDRGYRHQRQSFRGWLRILTCIPYNVSLYIILHCSKWSRTNNKPRCVTKHIWVCHSWLLLTFQSTQLRRS